MARKAQPRGKQAPAPPEPLSARHAVTPERFRRLHRLVTFLGSGPKSRERLLKHLEIDVRGFYRDLELLRAVQIGVKLDKGRYVLADVEATAIARLPFPDPRLTLGEVRQLAKGRTRTHAALREQIEESLS